MRDTLVELLRDGDLIHGLLPNDCSATKHRQILERIVELRRDVGGSSGAELRDILTTLSARIEIDSDSITLSISRTALLQHLGLAERDNQPDQLLIWKRPLTLRKRGVETKLVLGDVIADEPDQALIKLIADARSWMQRILDGEVASIRALARELDLDHRHVTRALPLAFLAPNIIRAIHDGRQPAELTVTSLKRLDPLPMCWDDQRAALDIPSTA